MWFSFTLSFLVHFSCFIMKSYIIFAQQYWICDYKHSPYITIQVYTKFIDNLLCAILGIALIRVIQFSYSPLTIDICGIEGLYIKFPSLLIFIHCFMMICNLRAISIYWINRVRYGKPKCTGNHLSPSLMIMSHVVCSFNYLHY